MEVLWLLYEHAFSEPFSEELSSLIQSYSRSFLGTLINEDGFNHLLRVSSNVSNGIMARHSRWTCLTESDLLRKHGHDDVKVTPTARSQGRERLPAHAFSYRSAADFSLGPDMLDMLTNDGSWSHPSPATDKLCGLMWLAWKACRADPSSFHHTWLSLLAAPGSLVSCESKNVRGIVTHSTAWGLVLVPVSASRECAGQIVFRVPDSVKPFYAVITDPALWKAGPPELLAPAAARQHVQSSASSGMLWKWDKEKCGSLMWYAAQSGFPHMTKSHLEKLMRYQKVQFKSGQRPTLVIDIVRVLVEHQFPKLSAGAIDKIVGKREAPKSLEVELSNLCLLHTGNNLENIRHC
eukprot:6467526-Amphidinium_carterae.1